MNRRKFLGRVGAVAAAVTVPISVSGERNADDFTYRGYRILWHGWSRPTNQIVEVGFWAAVSPQTTTSFVASTSMGHVGVYRGMTCVVMTGLEEGWPLITAFSTDAERAAVKERARLALVAKL